MSSYGAEKTKLIVTLLFILVLLGSLHSSPSLYYSEMTHAQHHNCSGHLPWSHLLKGCHINCIKLGSKKRFLGLPLHSGICVKQQNTRNI